ncbi:hypothetical protein [Streptomyces sp. NPDC048560]|uniref:hypothetical protein n=1 Tax=Streptomyces sp. NPDC048560 TaxID=3155488 RepID=UPI00341EA0C9
MVDEGRTAGDFEPGADATLAISQVSGVIFAADAKAGLLATALGIFTGGLLTQARSLRAMTPPHSAAEVMTVALTVIATAAVTASGWYLLRTLSPRSTTSASTRYGWPTLVTREPATLMAGEPGAVRHEAWRHAADLATIAERKFAAFRKALIWALVAGAALLASLIVFLWT